MICILDNCAAMFLDDLCRFVKYGRRLELLQLSYKRIFKEPNRPVGIETLEKISKALDVKIADLIDESGE
jgi:hypothetical protein